MKISLSNTFSDEAQVVVFPLLQGEHLKTNIESITARFGIVTDFLATDFKAAFKETLPLYLNHPTVKKIYLVGLGEKNGFGDFLTAFRSFTYQQKGKLPAQIAIDLTHLADENLDERIEAITNGVLLGRYNMISYKTGKNDVPEFANGHSALHIVANIKDKKKAQNIIADVEKIAATQLEIFDLVNKPANHKTPTILAKWAEKSGKKNGFEVKTFVGRKALEKIGCHAINAVNKGSGEDPALIIMEYKPKKMGKNTPTLGLVGKGVTFDTGGISIKPSANMHNMKSDMGGAAAVLGAMEAIAKLKLPIRVVGVVPSTENCVDGEGTKPSEVFGSYSGKTIEMIDTDAEGRIILADGLAYINKNFEPDYIIDLATLTGSIIGTLGYAAAGLFTNNDEMANDLSQVGFSVGEKVWRMPLWDNYKDDLNSDVADVRNFSGKPIAGAITAAKFLEVFTDSHKAWAHLDIAGMAFTDSEFATMRSGTAYGVRLLVTYAKHLANRKS